MAYTLRLAEILDALLPDGVDGTISTSPLSYAPWIDDDGSRRCTANVLRVADALRGTRIALAIEPEADGALADVDDLAPLVAGRARPRARDRLLRRLPLGGRLRGARRGARRARRRRASASARRSSPPRCGCRARRTRSCSAFADPIYLHQVTQRGSLPHRGPTCPRRWPATAAARSGACTSTCRSSSSATARSSPRRTTCGGASSACEHVAPGDRDVHVGRAAGRPEGLVGRLDRARVRVGARCPPLTR